MDSGLDVRILPSIRRSQLLLIYRNGGVDKRGPFRPTKKTTNARPCQHSAGHANQPSASSFLPLPAIKLICLQKTEIQCDSIAFFDIIKIRHLRKAYCL